MQPPSRLKLHYAIYVTTVTVIDPDTDLPVDIEIYKDLLTQGMVGIDAAFIDSDTFATIDPDDADSAPIIVNPYGGIKISQTVEANDFLVLHETRIPFPFEGTL